MVVDKPRDRSYVIEKENGNQITRNRRFIKILPELKLKSENDYNLSFIFETNEVYIVPASTSSGRPVKKPNRFGYV